MDQVQQELATLPRHHLQLLVDAAAQRLVRFLPSPRSGPRHHRVLQVVIARLVGGLAGARVVQRVALRVHALVALRVLPREHEQSGLRVVVRPDVLEALAELAEHERRHGVAEVLLGGEGEAAPAARTAEQPALNALLGDESGAVVPVVVAGKQVGILGLLDLPLGKRDLDVGELGKRPVGDEKRPSWRVMGREKAYDSEWTVCGSEAYTPRRTC